MANTFKSFILDGITGETGFTAVPADATQVIIGLQIANVGATTATVTVTLKDESASGDPKIHIVKSAPIPVGATLSLLDGKIVAEATDQIHVTSDIAVDGILSVLEQT